MNCICGELRADGRVACSLRRRANEHSWPASPGGYTALARGRDRAAAPRHDLLRRVRCTGRMPPPIRARSGGVGLDPACVPTLPRGTVQGDRPRLYWHRSETRANLCGGQGDAPAATVVERARGRRARRAGGRDGGGGGGRTVSPRARRARGGPAVCLGSRVPMATSPI